MLEKERGVCFHANMTHNKVFFERDKVETAKYAKHSKCTCMQITKKKKKELSVILAITVPLI